MEMEVIHPHNEAENFMKSRQEIDGSAHGNSSADDGGILNVFHSWTSPETLPLRGKRSRRKGSGGTRHQRILSASEYRHKPYPEAAQLLNASDRKLRRRVAEESSDRPRAPNNTNEFLMEYHESVTDPESDNDQVVYAPSRRMRTRTQSESIPSSAFHTSSPTLSLPGLRQFGLTASDDSITENDDESSPEVQVPDKGEVSLLKQNFEEIDFSKTYKNIHIETLLEKSKGDLVKEVLSLEKRIEILEKRIQVMAKPTKIVTSVQDDIVCEKEKIDVDRGFIKCLQQEICLLQEENRQLKSNQT